MTHLIEIQRLYRSCEQRLCEAKLKNCALHLTYTPTIESVTLALLEISQANDTLERLVEEQLRYDALNRFQEDMAL